MRYAAMINPGIGTLQRMAFAMSNFIGTSIRVRRHWILRNGRSAGQTNRKRDLTAGPTN